MKMIACFLIAMSVCVGCKVNKGSVGNDPIVTPSNISTEEQGAGAPIFPNFTPWWKE